MKFSLLKKLSKNVPLAIFIVLIFVAIVIALQLKLRKIPATLDKPNVILISVDTLRADHLGVYGYNRDTSPNIDALATKSTVFENSFTPVPCTAPSYDSLFTGLIPINHGSFNGTLDKKFMTLAQNFKNNGYNTGGIVSTGILANEVGGLARGFNTYNEVNQLDQRENRENTYGANGDNLSLQRGKHTTEEAVDWLSKNSDGRFFLFVQYADPHLPYGQKEAPFTNKYITGNPDNPLSNPDLQQDEMDNGTTSPEKMEYLKDRYDENISYADYYIGKLLDEIKSRGLFDNSIIIFTADHGESFEHNILGHCWNLYDSTTRVPLIIYDSRVQKRQRVIENTSLIDIYPTLINRVGLNRTNYKLDGLDLTPAIDSGFTLERDNLYLITSPSHGKNDNSRTVKGFKGQLFEVVSGTKRIIYNQNNGVSEAYDVAVDPYEKTNIITSLKENLENLLLWISKHPLPNNQIQMNDARYKALQGLGYL